MAGGGFGEWKDGLFVSAALFFEILFVEVNCSYLQRCIGEARDTTIVDLVFGFFDDIGGESESLLIGAFGGRFSTDTITNGIDMLGGGAE